MSELRFRHAALDDIARIVSLVESAYRGDASRAGWTTEANILEGQRIDAEGVRSALEKPNSIILLAEKTSTPSTPSTPSTSSGTEYLSTEILACCHIEKNGDAGYFGMFSVSPTIQGQGIGKAVIAEAEHLAQSLWQCQRMEMTVIDIRDELIAFYIRHGYRRTGKYLPFPYGDERFGIPLRDDLRFEVLEKELP
jgi:ribosomal protein S18 acetylase RimI-like enzyme